MRGQASADKWLTDPEDLTRRDMFQPRDPDSDILPKWSITARRTTQLKHWLHFSETFQATQYLNIDHREYSWHTLRLLKSCRQL